MLFSRKILVFCIFLCQSLSSTSPTLNKYDTFVLSSMDGIDNFPKPWVEGNNMSFDVQICPYYLEALSAINVDGDTNPDQGLLEEAGQWNLPGIYYNLAQGMFDATIISVTGPTTTVYDMLPIGLTIPDITSKVTAPPATFQGAPLATAYSAQLLLSSLGGSAKFNVTNFPGFQGVVENMAAGLFAQPNGPGYTATNGVATRMALTQPSAPALIVPTGGYSVSDAARIALYPEYKGFTVLQPPLETTAGATTVGSVITVATNTSTTPSTTTTGATSVSAPILLPTAQAASYRRQGLRCKLSCNLMPGVKVWAKGGLCQYKVKSNLLTVYNKTLFTSLTLPPASGTTTPGAVATGGDDLYQNLFTRDKLDEVFNTFGIDPNNVSNWSLEDTFVAAEFTTPITFLAHGSEGISKEALRLWPTLTVGAWLPTSRKPDATANYKLFDIPVSNRTHTGGSISASACMELQDFIFVCTGVSVSVFNTKTIDKYMLLTNPQQVGVSLDLFPVSRKPGKSYLGWIALYCKNFSDKWTAHAQYSITSHLQDQLTITDPILGTVFDPQLQPSAYSMLQKQIRQTAWSSHEFQAGLNLALSPNFEVGGCFKLVGMGENAPKTKTIMASIKVIF